MKASAKAALLSAFVFPGLGYFYLKSFRRGLASLLVVLGGMAYLVWSITTYTLERLDSVLAKLQGPAPSLAEISRIVETQQLTPPYYFTVFYTLVFVWIFAIIDCFRIGLQREALEEGKKTGQGANETP